MQWRLREGLGEAIYEIGVEDSGLMLGLPPDELATSMDTLRRMARQLGASLTLIREQRVANRKVAEVLVRKVRVVLTSLSMLWLTSGVDNTPSGSTCFHFFICSIYCLKIC